VDAWLAWVTHDRVLRLEPNALIEDGHDGRAGGELVSRITCGRCGLG
jgi:hypothetical protein